MQQRSKDLLRSSHFCIQYCPLIMFILRFFMQSFFNAFLFVAHTLHCVLAQNIWPQSFLIAGKVPYFLTYGLQQFHFSVYFALFKGRHLVKS